MVIPFIYNAWFLMPILCIVFCLNLVTIMKKVKSEESTAVNTFWLTFSFIFIMWSIAIVASVNVY